MLTKDELGNDLFSDYGNESEEELDFHKYFATQEEYDNWYCKKEKDREIELFDRMDKYNIERTRQRIKRELEDRQKNNISKTNLFGTDSSASSVVSSDEREHQSFRDRMRKRPAAPGQASILAPKRDVVVTKEQVIGAHIKRDQLEKTVHAPFFSDLVIGAYVLINVGKTKELRSSSIFCEVINVLRSEKIYDFGKTKTDKTLHIRYGDFEFNYRLLFVSNKECPNDLFDEYRRKAQKSNTLPLVEKVNAKTQQIRQLLTRPMTDKEVGEEVKEKNKFIRTVEPKKCLEKAALLCKLRNAQTAEKTDLIRIKELQQKIKQYERLRTPSPTVATTLKSTVTSQMLEDILKKQPPSAKRQGNRDGPTAFEKEFYEKYTGDVPFTRKKLQPQLITSSKSRTRSENELCPRIDGNKESTPKRKKLSPNELAEQYKAASSPLDELEFPPRN